MASCAQVLQAGPGPLRMQQDAAVAMAAAAGKQHHQLQQVAQQQPQQPQQVPPIPYQQTAVIFDWDDTLLASSWLTCEGLRLDEPLEVPREAQAQLASLEESVIKLLTRAYKLGRVTIVTNAETGWVELSAQRFMPRVVPLLSKARVISARSTFEAAYPDQPHEWKVQAFRTALDGTFGAGCTRVVRMGGGDDVDMMEQENALMEQKVAAGGAEQQPFKNVLSFGDSIHERDAVHRVAGAMPKTWSKSVKFVERPTIEQLKRQVDLVSSCFDYICSHGGDLDLMLTIQLLYN